jgi:tetratricopeptide (TPR) repeat protein
VRITAQLIDTSNNAQVWADRFEGDLNDIFNLQNQVTMKLVGVIAPKLDPADIDISKGQSTNSIEAYDLYLRGLANLRLGRGEAVTDALKLFNQAEEIDPGFIAARGMAAWCSLQGTATLPVHRPEVVVPLEDRPGPFLGVPPRIPVFTGRSRELEQLHEALAKAKAAAVTQTVGRAALPGLGGIGKTTLAIEYAYHFRKRYQGVCWCPAGTRVGLLSSLACLMVVLGAAPAEGADVEQAAKAALHRLAEKQSTWLLVYDNVPSPEEIADLLPAGGAEVLITSRFSDWSGWAEEVSLDVLPPDEAAALLQSRTKRNDEAGALVLAEALGYLPLALDHAAAYCKRTQMRFVDYASKAASLIAAAPRGAGYPMSVAGTFDLAIAQALEQQPAAESVMAYLAQCSPERIPMSLVEGAVDDESILLQSLAALSEVSLLKHDPFEDGTPAVSVHRLVQMVARARSQASGSASDALRRLIVRLAAIYPPDGNIEPKSWSLCAKLTPHVLVQRDSCCADAMVQAGGPEVLNRMGLYFHGRAAHAQAGELFRIALDAREKVLGPEHQDTATSLDNLADLLRDQGSFADALPLHQRALAIREKTLGPRHPDTATSLDNLAILLKARGDFAGARPLYARALAIREAALGPEHPATATSLNNLGNLLRDSGDLAAARPMHERALAIREKALGPEHSDTATSINNVAGLLKALGDFAAAKPLFQRALAIYEKALGPEHPATALSLNQLALIHQAQGDYEAARPLFERALAVRERALGHEHPATARSLNNLAVILKAQGDLAAARPLHERALAILEKALGPEHPHTATSLDSLADLLVAQGDETGALALHQRALAIREKVLGAEHPDTAASLDHVARLLAARGELARAQSLQQRALAIRERVFGAEHPETATSLQQLADVLLAQGRNDGAQPLLLRALAIRRKVLGPDHPDVKISRDKLAALAPR